MKYFLIWLGLAIVNEIIGLVVGFKLGYVLLAVIAGALAKAWQASGDAKEQKILPYSEIQDKIPDSVKEKCRELAGDREKLEPYLQEYAKQNLIKQKYVVSLLEEFAAVDVQTVPEQKTRSEQTVSLAETTVVRTQSKKEKKDPETAIPQTVAGAPPMQRQGELIACPACGRRQSAAQIRCAVCDAPLHSPAVERKPEPRKPEPRHTEKRPPEQEPRKQQPVLSAEQIQQLQYAINETYPGMMMFVRDLDLPDTMAAKYRPGRILRERAYVDASARVGGMVTSHRFAILSNHMTDLGMFGQNAQWQLHTAARDSRFKVLGVHSYQGKTAIFLLHLPDSPSWKLFREVDVDMDRQLLADCISRFEAKCIQRPIPELATEEWLSRCAFPIGMDDHGLFWEVE